MKKPTWPPCGSKSAQALASYSLCGCRSRRSGAPADETLERVLTTLEGHPGQLGVERGGFLDSRVLLAREDRVGLCEQVLHQLVRGGVRVRGARVHVAHPELHARPAAPLVDGRLEDEIDGGLVAEQVVDVRTAEGDGRNARHAIIGGELVVVAELAHALPPVHEHAGRGQERCAVPVTERLHQRELGTQLDADVGQFDLGVDAPLRRELLGGEGLEVAEEALAEGVDLVGRQRTAHSGGVAAEARQQPVARLECAEEVHTAHGATAAQGDRRPRS